MVEIERSEAMQHGHVAIAELREARGVFESNIAPSTDKVSAERPSVDTYPPVEDPDAPGPPNVHIRGTPWGKSDSTVRCG